MLRSAVVGEFYMDLADPAYETAFAIYHRRFSTNTTPKWPLAQPMRFLGHNGVRPCLFPLPARGPRRAAGLRGAAASAEPAARGGACSERLRAPAL